VGVGDVHAVLLEQPGKLPHQPDIVSAASPEDNGPHALGAQLTRQLVVVKEGDQPRAPAMSFQEAAKVENLPLDAAEQLAGRAQGHIQRRSTSCVST
jgi:hypothetical protein